MKSTTPILIGVGLVVILAAGVGFGWLDAQTVILVLVLVAVVIPVCNVVTTGLDPWLWWVGSAAFLAKLVGSAAPATSSWSIYTTGSETQPAITPGVANWPRSGGRVRYPAYKEVWAKELR